MHVQCFYAMSSRPMIHQCHAVLIMSPAFLHKVYSSLGPVDSCTSSLLVLQKI